LRRKLQNLRGLSLMEWHPPPIGMLRVDTEEVLGQLLRRCSRSINQSSADWRLVALCIPSEQPRHFHLRRQAMRRFLVGALSFAVAAIAAGGQSLDDLNIQIHGYATQGFLYTTQNNIFTTKSSDGSPEWTEAVVNISAQPMPKLRVGVQGRYFLLGNFGDAITLDWAAADYKANNQFGARFGKVKTPSGLFNETQDIDPSYIWSLLPQGIYPITSRNSILAHYGGVVYGTLKLGPQLGKLEYRGWGGEREIEANDGYWVTQQEEGLNLVNGVNEVVSGGALHWITPLSGLMLGSSLSRSNPSSVVITAANGAVSGTESLSKINEPDFFAHYEKDKLMVAAEYQRTPLSVNIQFPGPVAPADLVDLRAWYGMASYKLTGKLTVGTYESQYFDRDTALGPSRYSKDWAFSGRYDFNQFLYAKAEQHVIDGTAQGYDITLNLNGLQPNTKLTILKMGVSF
jgi:hypothetical protein